MEVRIRMMDARDRGGGESGVVRESSLSRIRILKTSADAGAGGVDADAVQDEGLPKEVGRSAR